MDLIITERGNTQSAYMQGEEWSDYGTYESTLLGLRAFLVQAKEKESRQIVMRVDDKVVVIEFVSRMSGIVLSQLIIDHNESDRDEILSELSFLSQTADQ